MKIEDSQDKNIVLKMNFGIIIPIPIFKKYFNKIILLLQLIN
jgi:hypothetical protein